MPSLFDLISSNNLSQMTNSILTLPHTTKKIPNIQPIYQEEEHNHHIISEEEGSSIYSNLQLKIGGKGKKHSTKKKQIDTYTKDK